jgi:hypothetical protein
MRRRPSSLTLVVTKLQECNMIRRNKFLTVACLAGFAAVSNGGPMAVSPALAACSKALVESIARAETLPVYTVKSPSPFMSESVDPNAFTMLAHDKKTKVLLAKASCKATPSGEIVSFKSIPLKS